MPVAIARIGCSTLRRTSIWAVGDVSCRIPSASDPAGKSVSPRAVIAPVIPTSSRAASTPPSGARRRHSMGCRGIGRPGSPPGGQRHGGQQEERIDQVHSEIYGASDGIVVGHQPEQHDPGPDQRLGHHEEEAGPGGAAHEVAGRKVPPGQYHQPHHEQQCHAARRPVRELDHGLRRRIAREHRAVAQRPMGAAAGTRTAGTHIGAPHDHGEAEGHHPPGVGGKAGSGHSTKR